MHRAAALLYLKTSQSACVWEAAAHAHTHSCSSCLSPLMTSCSCKQHTSAGRPVPHLQLPPHQLCLHDGGDRLTAVLLWSCTSAETEPQQLLMGMFPRVISNIAAGICSPESVKMLAVKLFSLSFSGVLMLQVQPQKVSLTNWHTLGVRARHSRRPWGAGGILVSKYACIPGFHAQRQGYRCCSVLGFLRFHHQGLWL